MSSVRKLGRYTLVEQLAVGGMAEIWLALLTGVGGFEKLVVIKKIRDHLAKEPSFLKMFLNEARIAAQLNHPNIVQIYELIQSGDTYFIAMEYIFGRDLAEISYKLQERNQILPIEYTALIILQVCEGLHYAHTKTDSVGNPLNIVHRDISPHNLLVSFNGNVKILDFGIAKATNQYEQTRHGILKGKISYMSPEQILGYQLDGRSDIFSLGTVFYELLTGFRLFTGDNDLATMRAITEEEIVRPSYFNEKISPDLEAIVLGMLAKDPKDRYPNAWEVQQDLIQFLKKFKSAPTTYDLANFIRQLFADEIEKEENYIRQKIAEIKSQSAEEEVLSEEDIVEDTRSYTNLLVSDPFWVETKLSSFGPEGGFNAEEQRGEDDLSNAHPVLIQQGTLGFAEFPDEPLSLQEFRSPRKNSREGEKTATTSSEILSHPQIDSGASGQGEGERDFVELKIQLDPDLYELLQERASTYQWSVEEWIYNLIINTLGQPQEFEENSEKMEQTDKAATREIDREKIVEDKINRE